MAVTRFDSDYESVQVPVTAAVAKGEVARHGALVGFYAGPAAAGESATLIYRCAEVDLEKTGTNVFAAGVVVRLDQGTGRGTSAAKSATVTPVGAAKAAVAAGDATVTVVAFDGTARTHVPESGLV